MRLRRLLCILPLAALTALPLAAPAQAAFPGENGRIAFACGAARASAICTMNPDGSGRVQLTHPDTSNGFYDTDPAWSADGQRIAFVRVWIDPDDPDYIIIHVWVMNGDGSAQVDLTPSAHHDQDPSWSPDGTRIAFSSDRTPGTQNQIYAMNPDGTGATRLATYAYAEYDPAWSPDGTKILFSRDYGGYEIWQMNSDGSGQAGLTSNSAEHDSHPNWSPDGTKVAFTGDQSGFSDVIVMNSDGSGQTRLTDDTCPSCYGNVTSTWSPDGSKIMFYSARSPAGLYTMNPDGSDQTFLSSGSSPDWQPIPAYYHHPQSASQLKVSLVPAFKPCGTGGNPINAKHAPPLATNSCNPPKPSVLAAVGGSSQSSAQMSVTPGDTDPTNGNQANVSISASLTDIQSTAGGDYNPNPSAADLTAVTRLRFTDKANGNGGLPATATEYDFKVPIDCSSTGNPTVGSTCTANTTANALVGGLIQEQRQTIVQAFRVRIDDSGANGIRGDSDDRIFATQGVFVP